MRRWAKGWGNAFETIGYYVERLNNRRGEDFVTRNVRDMRVPMIILASACGILWPIATFTQFDDPRLLPAIPLSIACISASAVAMGARTPVRKFGRMLFALLLLILMFAAIALSQTLWPAPN
jgi:hypothetical protein